MKTNNNKNKHWHDSFSGRIIIGVISGIILIFAGFLIKKYILTESPQQQMPRQMSQLEQPNHKTPQSPPPQKTAKKPVSLETPKTPQINAPNSVISIDQKGGITAGTVINANTVNIAPQKRRISAEQLRLLLPALRELCGTKIKIKYETGDQEQKQFAEDIINAFRSAGCTPEVPTPPLVRISAYGKGLAFGVNENPPYPPGAAMLQLALKQAHIDSQWHGFSKMERGLLEVHIGEKP
jgi:hypothetical protein